MTRKAAAKRSEANAAVRRRSAGLDQRFKMSASVAGFPSITRRRVSELLLLASARYRASTQVRQLLRTTLSSKAFPVFLRWKIYAVQNSCSAAVARLGCLH